MTFDPTKIAQLEEWLQSKEGEHFEFKEWKTRDDFERLARYCRALANEGGGRFILGVTDHRPRKVVGTTSFPQPERTRKSLCDHIPLAIDFEEIRHPDCSPGSRVLVFHVPPRPFGIPIKLDGRYWMRMEDSLVEMSEARLREVFAESGTDFSAGDCPELTLGDLDATAIEDFRRRWIARAREELIKQSKPSPDFSRTDPYQVGITLDGTVQDPAFIRFVEKVGKESTAFFGTHDWMIFAQAARGEKIPKGQEARLKRLLDLGLIERGPGRSHIPARRYYEFVGQKGVYTRRKGSIESRTSPCLRSTSTTTRRREVNWRNCARYSQPSLRRTCNRFCRRSNARARRIPLDDGGSDSGFQDHLHWVSPMRRMAHNGVRTTQGVPRLNHPNLFDSRNLRHCIRLGTT